MKAASLPSRAKAERERIEKDPERFPPQMQKVQQIIARLKKFEVRPSTKMDADDIFNLFDECVDEYVDECVEESEESTSAN